MKTTQTKSRDRRSGRYSYEGQWDRVCVCGETLANHDAEAPHAGQENTCKGFKPVKVKR